MDSANEENTNLHQRGDIVDGIDEIVQVADVVGDVANLGVQLTQLVLVHLHHSVHSGTYAGEIHVGTSL